MKQTAIYLTAIMILLAAIPASATESRIIGQGGLGLYIEDDTNVNLFPSLLSKYRNVFICELGMTNTPVGDRTAGVNFYLEDYDLDVGLHLNQMLEYPQQDYANINLENKFTLLLGKNNFGFGISYGSNSWNNDVQVNGRIEESATYFGLLSGVSIDSDKFPMEIGAGLSFPSGTVSYTGVDDDNVPYRDIEESVFQFGAIARGWMDLGGGSKMAVVLKFDKRSYTSDAGKDSSGYPIGNIEGSMLNLTIGLGINKEINENTLLVTAIEPFRTVRMSSSENRADNKVEADTTVTLLPALYAGLETQIKPWLVVRFGVGQKFSSTTTMWKLNNTTTSEITRKDSEFRTAFGIGFKFEDFEIDGNFNEQFLYSGPNFISGQSNDLLTSVSIKYTW